MGIERVSRVRTFLLKLTERLSLRAPPPHPLNAERRGDAVVASSVMGSGVPASTPSGPDTSQMWSFESYEPEHTDRPCGGARVGVGEGRGERGAGGRRAAAAHVGAPRRLELVEDVVVLVQVGELRAEVLVHL